MARHPRCFIHAVAIGSVNPAITLAALDLSLVRLLRGAMSPGGNGAVTALGPAPTNIASRAGAQPEPVIEPRVRYHPTPRFEPRPVHHPEPRFVPREDIGLPPIEIVEATECRSKKAIEAPWQVLPWEKPLPPPPVIKVYIRPPDKVISRGSLIDFYG